jgi:regulator of ribonuclease activity A
VFPSENVFISLENVVFFVLHLSNFSNGGHSDVPNGASNTSGSAVAGAINTASTHTICLAGMCVPKGCRHYNFCQPRKYHMNSTFATCDLCDAFKNDVSGEFRVLPPVFRDFGAIRKFAGPVVTVKCHEDNTLVKAAVDSIGYEDTAQGRVAKVLVVDGGASLRRALLGGNLGAAAAKNGWAGVVIDGCVRDVAELSQANVGIRALASMPLPTEKRNQGQAQVAVQIQGVWVRPGDWLYADEDGMVVSARALV